MQIIPASQADLAAVIDLLAAADLPTADVGPQLLEQFLVVHERDALVGAVGLGLAGDIGLLRSLVVADPARGRGLGNQLVEAAACLARRRGVRQLYLLTTTADRYFAQRGYQTVAREAAPAALRETPQFKTLCPSSSVVMTKAL